MTTALEGGEGSASYPGRSLPPGKTRYPLYRRLGGPQDRSGQVRKILPPPGFDPRTVQPVASPYTDCATRPTKKREYSYTKKWAHHPWLTSHISPMTFHHVPLYYECYCKNTLRKFRFYILLTAHLNITSGRWPTWYTVLLYNTFISTLYMFRANMCSSSGGQLY